MNQSSVPWPDLRRQVMWSGIPIYSKIFHSFVVMHTVKGISIVNEAGNVFIGISLFFLWSSGCWQFDFLFLYLFKSSLYIWKLLVHILLKPSLKDFEHNLASMWKECNCMVIWTLFGIALLWDWNENWPFPVLWPLLNFLNLLAYWVQHFNSIIF